jgi:uncharacterized protein (TIGR02145 family)
MIVRILLFSLLPFLSFAQSNSKVAIPVNTQTNEKGPVEPKRNTFYNLDEIKVRWKKAALENCPGVPCPSLYPPGPCSAIVATPTGPSSASVSFGLPTYDGGSPITGYVVSATPTSSAPAKRKSSAIITATGTAPPIIVTGLTFGVNYIFTVLATNIVGPSPSIATTNTVTPCVLNTATAASSSPTLTVNTILTNITHSTTIATGIGTATGLPSGVTASWLAGTITISGTPTVTGIFNYTIPLTGGCGSVNATGTITVAAAALATLSTTTVTSITDFGAISGGNITSDGGSSVTVKGVVWSSSNSPNVSLSTKTTDGTGTGTFTSTISGLTANTRYYVRAYATNASGTSYGSVLTFITTAVPNTVPGAPTGVMAAAGNAQAIVSFIAPSSNGGSAITGYTVTSNPAPTGGVPVTWTGTGPSITATGLTNGTPYTFTVVATNVVGNSVSSSASNSVTPAAPTVPGAPTIGTAVAGNTQATVSFTAPSSTGGSAITGYTVTSNPAPAVGPGTWTGTGPSITATGLTNGTPYTFTVVATNAVGNSLASSASNSVTPATVPDAPTSVNAVRGNALAIVSFTGSSSTGGSAITGYTVTSSPAGGTGNGTSSPITVTGLTNGTSYTFSVVATNAEGNSSPGISSAVTPATVPNAPTGVMPVAGNAQATVSFTTPSSDGGSAITGYTVTANSGSSTVTAMGTTTSIIVTGLTNGTPYTFTVVATNAVGNSLASSASTSVTPTAPTVPGAPTGVMAVAGNAQATVSFTTPSSDGGSAITGYTVTSIPAPAQSPLTWTGAGTSITATGLTNGTSYQFTVVATNVVGNSAASSASNSVTPATVPDAPTIGTAVAGNAQATVSFTVPSSDGGSAITGYTVTSSPAPAVGLGTWTGTGTSITATGLTNGTPYTFTVVATNAVGNSVPSSASNSVTPATVPDAPTIGTAVAGNNQATVSFTTPSSDGGSAITGYTVTSSPAPTGGVPVTWTSTGTVTSITATGLTNGQSYTFTVVATNGVGNSAASSASNSVTPAVPVCPSSQITDVDNNPYNTVAIGTQCWTKTNLKVTKYNDGITAIPLESTGNSNGSSMTWQDLVTGAYTIYGNESSTSTNAMNYGFLYNWYAAAGIITSGGAASTKNICPTGWKVPSDADWTTLIQYIDNTASATAVGSQSTTAGGKLKSTTLWIAGSPDMPGTDDYDFEGLPGGTRVSGGSFSDIGVRAFFWSTTDSGTNSAWGRSLYNYSLGVFRSHDSGNDYKSSGASIRCLKN